MIKRVDKTSKNMGKWIRQFRGIHGMSQTQFAKLTGISKRTIYKLEAGREIDPYFSTCQKIAKIVGISLDSLYSPLDSEKTRANSHGFELLAKRAHRIAREKEWWKDYDESPGRWKPYVLATKIALISSEISEALEEARRNQYKKYMVGKKPEGVVVELADAIIRIFDLCERLGLDLKSAILEKLDYNETRPVKHGNKVF